MKRNITIAITGLFLLHGTVCSYVFAGPLHIAAKEGDLSKVKQLLDRGALIDGQDDESETPLQLAASEGHTSIVEQLIAYGANIYAGQGAPSLHRAIQSDVARIVELLLTYGADPHETYQGLTPLYLVPKRISPWKNFPRWQKAPPSRDADKIAELLFSFGAQVDAPNRIKTFPRDQHSHNRRYYEVYYDEYDIIALHRAAMHGDAEIITILLKHGADPYARVRVQQRVRRLYSGGGVYRGPSASLSSSFDKLGDLEGMTPLHFAAWRGYPEIIQLLLTNGGDIQATDARGRTPLHFTAFSRYAGSAAQQLIDQGAAIDASSRFGQTPLHLCAQQGNERVTAQLLSHGADMYAEDNKGNIPLDFARHRTLPELLALLREHGVKE